MGVWRKERVGGGGGRDPWDPRFFGGGESIFFLCGDKTGGGRVMGASEVGSNVKIK